MTWLTDVSVMPSSGALGSARTLRDEGHGGANAAVRPGIAGECARGGKLARTDRRQECLAACDRALALLDDPEVRNLRAQVVAAEPRAIEAAA